MQWQLIEEGPKSAQENMQKDGFLLENLALSKHPILHLYDWLEDSATYGHFIDPSKHIRIDNAHRLKLQLAKRPTGGGIIFHISDLAFSVLIPAMHIAYSNNTLENYAFVNHKVIEAIQIFFKINAYSNEKISINLLPKEPLGLDSHCKVFCMAKPTKYDVMINGKKVGGAAQRKTRFGFLHQGSISIAKLSEDYLTEILHPETAVLQGMRHNSHYLMDEKWDKDTLTTIRHDLRSLLKQVFMKNN